MLFSCYFTHLKDISRRLQIFFWGGGSVVERSMSRKADVLFSRWAIRGGKCDYDSDRPSIDTSKQRDTPQRIDRARKPEPPAQFVFKQSHGRGVTAARPGGGRGRGCQLCKHTNTTSTHLSLRVNDRNCKKTFSGNQNTRDQVNRAAPRRPGPIYTHAGGGGVYLTICI